MDDSISGPARGLKKMGAMRERVKEEIRHIPRGDNAQNELRMFYWPGRMNSLKGGKEVKIKEEVLKDCVQWVRKDHPNFSPRYDKDYFNIDI